MKAQRLLWLFLFILFGLAASPSEALAQNVLRCSPSISPASVTVGTTLTGTTEQTINMTARFACRSTTSGSKTGRLTATIAFLDNSNVRIGTYLRRKTGAELIGYTFNRSTNLPVANTASTTFPSCTGAAPSQTTNGAITLFSDFNVIGPGSFAVQDYYLNLCVRIPRTNVDVAGSYVGKLQLETTGSVSGGGGNFQTSTNNDASIMTATIESNCTVGTLPNATFNYTSFTTTDSVFSRQLATVSCNSGSWKVDIRDSGSQSVTTPLTGKVKGINYELGLSNTANLPNTALSPTYPTNGTIVGSQTLYLLGRAAAGQAGDSVCANPCATSATYTLTITYD